VKRSGGNSSPGKATWLPNLGRPNRFACWGGGGVGWVGLLLKRENDPEGQKGMIAEVKEVRNTKTTATSKKQVPRDAGGRVCRSAPTDHPANCAREKNARPMKNENVPRTGGPVAISKYKFSGSKEKHISRTLVQSNSKAWSLRRAAVMHRNHRDKMGQSPFHKNVEKKWISSTRAIKIYSGEGREVMRGLGS